MDKKALTLITRILFDRYLKAYETPITGKKKKEARRRRKIDAAGTMGLEVPFRPRGRLPR